MHSDGTDARVCIVTIDLKMDLCSGGEKGCRIASTGSHSGDSLHLLRLPH